MERIQVTNVQVARSAISFTISGCSVSLPNAIRRTILSDIPCVVIDTDIDSQAGTKYVVNSTRQTNEMISQRLAAVPVHIVDTDFDCSRYSFEIKVANTTDTSVLVTTKDISLFETGSRRAVAASEARSLFPPCQITSDYIELAVLRPGSAPSLLGEELHLTGGFKVATSAENGSYAVATEATCTNTTDAALIKSTLASKEKEWLTLGLAPAAIQVRRNDFLRLEAMRLYIPRSFQLRFSTVGVFPPSLLVVKAISILVDRLGSLNEALGSDPTLLAPSESTIPWAYELSVGGDGHTIGRLIESIIFDRFYTAEHTISYCGFVKPHPHVPVSTVRFAFVSVTDQSEASSFIRLVIDECVKQLEALIPIFS